MQFIIKLFKVIPTRLITENIIKINRTIDIRRTKIKLSVTNSNITNVLELRSKIVKPIVFNELRINTLEIGVIRNNGHHNIQLTMFKKSIIKQKISTSTNTTSGIITKCIITRFSSRTGSLEHFSKLNRNGRTTKIDCTINSGIRNTNVMMRFHELNIPISVVCILHEKRIHLKSSLQLLNSCLCSVRKKLSITN